MSGRGISAGGGVAGETGVEGPGSADELAEIQALYVSPESQSRGVGGRLLEAALSRARATGVAGARLSVLAGNAGARRFYERYGFQLVRTSRDEIAPGVEIDHAHYALRWTSAGSGRMGTSR